MPVEGKGAVKFVFQGIAERSSVNQKRPRRRVGAGHTNHRPDPPTDQHHRRQGQRGMPSGEDGDGRPSKMEIM